MPPRKTAAANHTLVNGLRLLERIAAGSGDFSVSELAAALSLPKSHVHRLLRTLLEAGYVEQSADTRKYRSDYRLLALAGPFAERLPLRVHGGPVLRGLSEAAQGSSYLAVLHQEAPLVIMSDPYRGLRPAHTLGVGERLVRHATAFGKLFLALKRLPVEAGELTRLTPCTITTLRELRTELAAIRRQGYSVNRCEHTRELYSFAAPVVDATGVLAGAVGLAIPAPVVIRRGEAHFIRLVVRAAEDLSRQPL
ncbi:MAG: transcriptional regulator [Rariglobus sp.]|jgi:DNA-binding IclR family transcriptional regulator|nr:transcriptional regulator [Rariglobus sp.]